MLYFMCLLIPCSLQFYLVYKWIFGVRIFKAFEPEDDKDVKIYL